MGDVIAREGQPGQGPGRGAGPAGQDPGADYYEAEIDIDELAALIFEDLRLPFLEDKGQKAVPAKTTRFNEIRRTGVMANLDKRRMILENIKRNARETNVARFGNVKKEDLRFKTWEEDHRYESNAVVLAMHGRVGFDGRVQEVHRALVLLLDGEISADEVRQRGDRLYHPPHGGERGHRGAVLQLQGESGGTEVSSAYQLALDIVRERYSPRDWNIYPFHFSDGDNYYSDNEEAVRLADEMIQTCNLFGYGEIGEEGGGGYRRSSGALLSIFNDRLKKKERFIGVRIDDKEDVYPALKQFFGQRGIEV